MKVVVVGHVEWVRFLPVDAAPRPGVILHSDGGWAEPGGGGGVAAVELARIAGSAHLFTALGNDPIGRQIPSVLERAGVSTHTAWRAQPHRQALTFIDPDGERTITVVGPAQQPLAEDLDPAIFDDVDGVYFCKGDAAWLRAARRARVLVATARVLDVVQEAGVQLDALVHSAVDPKERYQAGDLALPPRLVAQTRSEQGGTWAQNGEAGRWSATDVPGPVEDAYGCGDCFAAGLTWALAHEEPLQRALNFAATRGALALTRRGVGLASESAVS